MNRLISIGLAIAVAPAIFLAIGQWIESPEAVYVSEVALFNVALPLGALLVIVGLCKAVINMLWPSQLLLASQITAQEQIRCEILEMQKIPLNFLRLLLSAFQAVSDTFYRLAKNRVLGCVMLGEMVRKIQNPRRLIVGFLQWLVNGCYSVCVMRHRLVKNRVFWQTAFDNGVRFLGWLPSQIAPLLLTGVLGFIVAGAADLPVNAFLSVLLVLDNLSGVFKAEGIAKLGYVRTCEWNLWRGTSNCFVTNLRAFSIMLWVTFYVFQALWRRLKAS